MIKSNFKLWSEVSSEARKKLSFHLPYQKFEDLTHEEKSKMWSYLRQILFESMPEKVSKLPSALDLTILAVTSLNDDNKLLSPGHRTLELMKNNGVNIKASRDDFKEIFLEENDAIILELFSYYLLFFKSQLVDVVDRINYQQREETDEEFKERKCRRIKEIFDDYKDRLNDIFKQFSIAYYLSNDSFFPRQEEKIIDELYKPVLKILNNDKWKEVDLNLKDAFESFVKHTPKSYSECITQAISTLEAFMQISIYGKTGKGTLGRLVKEARKREQDILPKDDFSIKIIGSISNFLARQRKKTSTSHPKMEYATEANCRLILNLIVLIIQHSLQNQAN